MNSYLREYAVETQRFLNILSDLPELVPVVAPGMAVNMYYQSTSSTNSPSDVTYLHTTDLDITVFMKRKVCVHTLRNVVRETFDRFDRACADFVRYYNTQTGEKATLIKKCLQTQPNVCMIDITRKQGAPFFDRNVFAVKQYFVRANQTTHELMDVVVAYQPKFSNPVDTRMSAKTGFPVPKIGYLIPELWKMIHVDILGTSPFNKKRHPIIGKEHTKGLKDLYRLRFVLSRTRDKRYDKYRKATRHLLNIIKKNSYDSEKKTSRIKNVLLQYNETPSHS
jgi:hypothetical protein